MKLLTLLPKLGFDILLQLEKVEALLGFLKFLSACEVEI